MAAPTKQRFKNITTAKLGASLEINTLKEITVDEQTDVIEDAGDNATASEFLEKGMTRCNFTVQIADPIQAEAMKAAAKGDLIWSGEPSTGGTAVNCTLAGAILLNRSQRSMFNGVWVTQLTGRATGLTVAAAT